MNYFRNGQVRPLRLNGRERGAYVPLEISGLVSPLHLKFGPALYLHNRRWIPQKPIPTLDLSELNPLNTLMFLWFMPTCEKGPKGPKMDFVKNGCYHCVTIVFQTRLMHEWHLPALYAKPYTCHTLNPKRNPKKNSSSIQVQFKLRSSSVRVQSIEIFEV